jgi:hypothetical protein
MSARHANRAIAAIVAIIATTTAIRIIAIVGIPATIITNHDDVRFATAEDAAARTTRQTENRQPNQTSAHTTTTSFLRSGYIASAMQFQNGPIDAFSPHFVSPFGRSAGTYFGQPAM